MKDPKKTKKPVSIVMVAMGGYGYYYLKTIFEEFSPGSVSVGGVVDPAPQDSEMAGILQERSIPVYASVPDFYASGAAAELAVITSPIHFHDEQCCEALLHGSHVLCEKPVAGTVQEVDHLIHIRDRSNRWVMIGYQWSFSKAIQDLKKDIIKGLFGRPLRFKTLYLWPRDSAYYTRNDWAGKKRSQDNRWILDSPANSAMAHDLHNLFYLLGETTETSAIPVKVTAEAYRANPIENYDTTACRIRTAKDTELLFYVSHAVPEKQGPFFSLEFEEAVITFDGTEMITARNRNGRNKHYGSPFDSHQFTKLFHAVQAVRQSLPILCGPEAGRSQVLCMNGIQESVQEIVPFPESSVAVDTKRGIHWIRGLSELFYDCYVKAVLPCEANQSWTRRGQEIDLKNYTWFPQIERTS
jgi:predicted dehydrogenase